MPMCNENVPRLGRDWQCGYVDDVWDLVRVRAEILFIRQEKGKKDDFTLMLMRLQKNCVLDHYFFKMKVLPMTTHSLISLESKTITATHLLHDVTICTLATSGGSGDQLNDTTTHFEFNLVLSRESTI